MIHIHDSHLTINSSLTSLTINSSLTSLTSQLTTYGSFGS